MQLNSLQNHRLGQTLVGVTLYLIFFAHAVEFACAQIKEFEVFGETAGESLGAAIACQGPEVIVGAPGTTLLSHAGVGEARFFDFTGKNLLYKLEYPTTPSGNEFFGHSLLTMPDINADNFDQIIVGSPALDGSMSLAAFYVFERGSNQPPIFSIFGQSGDALGKSLALINYPIADGFPEIVAGAPRRIGSGASGAVIIYDAKNNLSILETLNAPFDAFEFGESIAVSQDLTKDGSDDLLVGSPGAQSSEGAVFIFSPRVGMSPSLARTIRGNVGTIERIGTSVISVGDLNGDSIDEILVGGPAASNDTGIVRLYSGADITSPNNNIASICEISGNTPGEFFGSSLAAIGDTNGDGSGEFAVAAPGASGQLGEIRLYQYTTSGTCQFINSIVGETAGEELGKFISAGACGDTTNYPKKLVAGTSSGKNASGAGSAVIFAPPTPTPTPTLTPTPTPAPTINPSKLNLSFRISETGEFRISRTYDAEPAGNCSYVLYGRVQVGNKILELEKLSSGIFDDTSMTERVSVTKILNFPRARKVSGVIPILHMLTRTSCDGKSFDSNVFARYMNCGTPDTSLDLASWISTLKSALTSASKQQSIRTNKTVQVIRLKKRKRRDFNKQN